MFAQVQRAAINSDGEIVACIVVDYVTTCKLQRTLHHHVAADKAEGGFRERGALSNIDGTAADAGGTKAA